MIKRAVSFLTALILFLALVPTVWAGYIDSDWVLESDAPEGAEIVDEKWEITRTTYVTKEGDPEKDEFETIKTDWVPKGRPVNTYYGDIPGGFDSSDQSFRKYREHWGQQTGYTHEAEKVEVTNSFETYIYWHWMYDCGGANGHSGRAILDYRGTGPDNRFGYRFFAAFASTRGDYSGDRYYCNSRNIYNYIVPEKTSYGETKGATRWFRFNVYRSSAQKYVKMYYCKSVSTETEMNPNKVPKDKVSTEYTGSDGDENNKIVTSWERYVRYKIEAEDVAAPQANFPTGSQLSPDDEITLSCATPNATILYTISENVADPQPADAYIAPFKVLDKENFTVAARAVRKGMADSETVFFTYHIGNLQGFPTVTTNEALDIEETSARLSCTVESESRVLQTQFAYYEKGDNMRQYVVNADSNGEYLLENLTPGTEYWFQARATNLSGFASGNVRSFRTKGTPGRTPASVSISPSYVAITPGGTRTLLATVLPVMAKRDIVWSSEDESVATVDNQGRVTAKGVGLTTIMATTVLGRKQAACKVEVFSKPDITGKYDFSEFNMIMACSRNNTETGFDFHALRGGNSQMASAYLTRWDGAVVEENDPYPSDIIDRYTKLKGDFHVQEILYLPWRSGPQDNDEIKNAVMNYGAVYAALRTGSDYRNNNDRDFYLPANRRGSKGHSLAVVGWDDTYPRSNFSFTPPGDGAFICKNSWGTQSGEDGFCYVSYYDSSFAMKASDDVNAVFYYAQTSDNYNKIYQYDELGAVDVYEDFGGASGWYANVFPRQGEALTKAEILKAVSFYTVSPGTSYELYIVTNYQGPNSLCQLGQPIRSDSIDYAGYHTITLKEPISLAAGTRFAVVLRITDQTGNASVFIEAPRVGISSKARACVGESFVRGANGQWRDLTTLVENANLCVKAFTLADSEEEAVLKGVAPLYDEGLEYTEAELTEMSAGLNPAYLASLCGSGEEEEDPNEPASGLVPPSTLPNLNSSFHYAEGAQFREKFDLRTEGGKGYVTPVKYQHKFPACWAFSAYASLESCILKAADSGYSLVGGLNQAGEEDICVLLENDESLNNMPLGAMRQLLATIYPFDSDAVLFWESSDSSVASVSPRGTVTAKAPGTAQITVSTEDKNVCASCTVQVLETEGQAPQSLSISIPKAVIESGDMVLMEHFTYPVLTDSEELVWESDDPTVAQVDEFGLLTAVGRGMTTIRASTADGTLRSECTISVDGGEELVCAILSNELIRRDGIANGTLSMLVRNRGAARKMSMVLAFYSPEGQLLDTMTQEIDAETGDNKISFSVPDFSCEAGVVFRLFSLSGDSSMKPLDFVLEGSLDNVE